MLVTSYLRLPYLIKHDRICLQRDAATDRHLAMVSLPRTAS